MKKLRMENGMECCGYCCRGGALVFVGILLLVISVLIYYREGAPVIIAAVGALLIARGILVRYRRQR